MVKCPECGFHFEIGSSICPRHVAITKREKIKSLNKAINKRTKRAEKFWEVIRLIENNFYNKIITSKLILNLMGWADHSDGDVTLTFLDFFVCKGNLQKIVFKKGRGGHKYHLVNIKPCPYLKEGECNCPLNLYKHIKEEKEVENVGIG